MDRSGWLQWAWTATLVGAIVAANGFVIAGQMGQAMQDASRAQPPEAPWFADLAPVITAGASLLLLVSAAAVAYGWAKARAKARQPRAAPAAEDTVEADDRIVAPPGFGGPAVRTQRAGAGPLLGWSIAGVALLAGGCAIVALALMTLGQTAGMDGRGFRQAALWVRLLRFAGLPLLVLAGTGLGAAWGRWFPLGALEVMQAQGMTEAKPLHLKWQRHE